MSTPLPFGSRYRLGVVQPPPAFTTGRLLVTGPAQWSATKEDYQWGWDHNAQTSAHHAAFVQDALDWLCGAHTGLSVLVAHVDPPVTDEEFGDLFQGCLTGLGNTVTLTGNGQTWGGRALSDFNLLVMHGAGQTLAPVRDATDAYLDAGYGSVLGSHSPGGWARYGINNVFDLYSYDADWLQHFYCAPLGSGYYALECYAEAIIDTYTKTRPGTTTFYAGEFGEKMIALWENP